MSIEQGCQSLDRVVSYDERERTGHVVFVHNLLSGRGPNYVGRFPTEIPDFSILVDGGQWNRIFESLVIAEFKRHVLTDHHDMQSRLPWSLFRPFSTAFDNSVPSSKPHLETI